MHALNLPPFVLFVTFFYRIFLFLFLIEWYPHACVTIVFSRFDLPRAWCSNWMRILYFHSVTHPARYNRNRNKEKRDWDADARITKLHFCTSGEIKKKPFVIAAKHSLRSIPLLLTMLDVKEQNMYIPGRFYCIKKTIP